MRKGGQALNRGGAPPAPYQVILFDEIEKGRTPMWFNVLLQVARRRAADGLGRVHYGSTSAIR